jgi:hypothetical protein
MAIRGLSAFNEPAICLLTATKELQLIEMFEEKARLHAKWPHCFTTNSLRIWEM